MKFEKWQGTGNDFVVVNADEIDEEVTASIARKICDRHFGIGADGVLVLRRKGSTGEMKIFNADGSVAEMCGNGIRIAAAVLGADVEVIQTDAGEMYPTVIGGDSPDCVNVKVAMGKADLIDRDLSVTADRSDGQDQRTFHGMSVSMGNPHYVIVDEPSDENVLGWGPHLESHDAFPNRSNIEFISIDDVNQISMRVWERGVGETLACGTGACASAVSSIVAGFTESPVTVNLPGGNLTIEVDDDLGVHMTGEARRVFSGVIVVA